MRFFAPNFFTPKQWEVTFLIYVVSYSPCKQSKPKKALKKLKKKCENFFLKIIKNWPKTGKKTKKSILKNSKCRHTFLLDSSERSHRKFSCNVLLVDTALVVHELSPQNCQIYYMISFYNP